MLSLLELFSHTDVYSLAQIEDGGSYSNGAVWIVVYSTHHTFTTIMLQDSIVCINELAGLLGNSTPKITVSYYASVIDTKTIDLGRNFNLYETITTYFVNRRL